MLTVRTVQSLIREKKKGNEERIGRVGGGGEDEKKREGTAEKSEDCNGVGGCECGLVRREREDVRSDFEEKLGRDRRY